MNLKRNITAAMAVLSAVAFSFTSCSDSLDGDEGKSNEEPMLTVPATITANFGSQGAKTRGIGMTENSKGFLQYNFAQLYETQESTSEAAFDLVVTPRLDGSKSTNLTVFEDVPIKKSGDNYYVELTDVNLPILGSASNNLNSLLYCGVLVPNGTGTIFYNSFRGDTDYKGNHSMAVLANYSGDFFVPLYSSTKNTTVKVEGDNTSSGSTIHLTMDFWMMGTAVTAKFKSNPLANDVYIDSVGIPNGNVKSGPFQWLMGDEDSNGNPTFTFYGTDDQNKRLTFPKNSVVVSDLFNSDVTKLKSWVMIDGSDDFVTDYDIYYHLKGDVDYNSIMVKYPQSSSAKTITVSGGLKYGTVNNIAMRMPESDLMITEFEHLNPSMGGSNYSLIELYNPTKNNIDLRNYGLVRLTDFQRPQKPTDAEVTDLEEEWKAYGSDDKSSDFQNARVQDIYISGTEFVEKDEYYKGPSGVRTVAQSYSDADYTNAFALFDASHIDNLRTYPATADYTYNIGEHEYTAKNLAPYELGPGQTVIVGAGAIEYEATRGTAWYKSYWHSNANCFDNYYLDKAAAANRLRYAVAVDNAKNGAHGHYGNYVGSGVMQHDMSSIMQLVKLTTGEVIDMPGYIGNTASRYIYSEYIAKDPDAAGTVQRDYFVFSRNPSAMYPLYLNKRYYTDSKNADGLTERYEEGESGSSASTHAYRMYDWIWYNASNFIISSPLTDASVSGYESLYFSPGTKTFENTYNYPNNDN